MSLHFKKNKLACRCGCGMMPDPNVVTMLEAVSELFDKPIDVTSAARCKKHNVKVGGAPNSRHVEGRAFDVGVDPVDMLDFIVFAADCGFRGIGIMGKGLLHIDARDKDAVWTYPSKGKGEK